MASLGVERRDAGHVAGWVEGVFSHIEIARGGCLLGIATPGEPRPDLNARFGRSEARYHAFRYDFAQGQLRDGLNHLILKRVGGPAESVAVDLLTPYRGYCHACAQDVGFASTDAWYRDNLLCDACGSQVRERALARVLNRLRPDWRSLTIHESSPLPYGFSAQLAKGCPLYVGSHYRPDHPFGSMQSGFRNEDLGRQTFADASFDIVVSLDVMEHVLAPQAVYAEVYRTLRPGGLYLHTFPIRKWLCEAVTPRVRPRPDGSLEHLAEPEYHGNPIDPQGSIVTYDYGYDIHGRVAEWAPFGVEIARFHSERFGILGEYTEVVICTRE